jgi:transposase-like protein
MGTKRRFTDSEKMEIIESHLSGASIYSLSKKYSLHSAQIYEWLYHYGIKKKQTDIAMGTTGKSESVRVEELQKEVRQLRKELAEEKLRSIAYDKMIDVAEEMFHLAIRKKAGTKQSKR